MALTAVVLASCFMPVSGKEAHGGTICAFVAGGSEGSPGFFNVAGGQEVLPVEAAGVGAPSLSLKFLLGPLPFSILPVLPRDCSVRAPPASLS